MIRRIDPIEPLDVDEVDVLTFDFASALADGETLTAPSVTSEVYHGTDAAPSSLLDGSAQITGATVLQRVTGSIAGVTYLMRCAATTSAGRVLVAACLLPVVRLQ